MSAHRQHAFDIPSNTKPIPQLRMRAPLSAPTSRELAFALAAFAICAAMMFGLVVAIVHAGPVTEATPVDDGRARIVAARLADWRAGYEAAVDSGCKLQPLLTSPITSHP